MTRALVIGTGYGAQVVAPALRAMGRFAAVDVVAGRGQPQKLDELLAADEVDFVVIAVPPRAQPELVARARRAGRAVLVEKPAGLTPGLIGSGPGRVFVGYEFRFMRGLGKWLALSSSGAVGRLRRVEFDWRIGGWAKPERPWSWRCLAEEGGGALKDLAVHELDLLRCLTQAPIGAINGLTAGIRHGVRLRADGSSAAVTAPDRLGMELVLSDGIVASFRIETALDQPVGHRITAIGDAGVLEWFHPAPFLPGAETLTGHGAAMSVYDLPPDAGGTSDTRIAAFTRMVEAMFDDEAAVAGPEDSDRILRDIALIDAAIDAVRGTDPKAVECADV